MKNDSVEKDKQSVDRDLVRKVARAIWVETYLANNEKVTPKEAAEAWKTTDAKPHLRIARRVLNRLSKNNINI